MSSTKSHLFKGGRLGKEGKAGVGRIDMQTHLQNTPIMKICILKMICMKIWIKVCNKIWIKVWINIF